MSPKPHGCTYSFWPGWDTVRTLLGQLPQASLLSLLGSSEQGYYFNLIVTGKEPRFLHLAGEEFKQDAKI
jgi:hypothetical protein